MNAASRAEARGLKLDVGERHHLSKPVIVLSITQVITAAGLVFSMVMHSTDSDSAVMQRVASNEASIRAIQEGETHRDEDMRDLRLHLDQKLDATDGKITDMYRVLLNEIQQKDNRR